MGLTVEDVRSTGLEGAVEDWHGMLLRLRDHYADPAVNPRERFSVGVSSGADGRPAGVAVTSIRQPLADQVTVRQTGALAYSLLRTVDGRIDEHQQRVHTAADTLSAAELDELPKVEVAQPAL
jgi:hypothetical protein